MSYDLVVYSKIGNLIRRNNCPSKSSIQTF